MGISHQKLRLGIYQTLAYSKIFNFPLKLKEVIYWLVGIKEKSLLRVEKCLNSSKYVNNYLGYYSLGLTVDKTSKLKHLVETRIAREHHSHQKFLIARQTAKWLRLIPAIEMVAITGTLAVNQAKENDDIDMMIVTAPGVLWTTRLFYLAILQILGVRRKPLPITKSINNIKMVKNKICPNLLLDRNHCQLPKKQQDIYYAHEILQVRLLWDRHKTYTKFINENAWIAKILPNAWDAKLKEIKLLKTEFQIDWPELIIRVICCLLRLAEPITRSFQLWYMSSKRTRETVTPYMAQFYPIDYHLIVMKEYERGRELMGIR